MWMVDPPTQEMWLFNATASNLSANLKRNDWAERVSTQVAANLGVLAAVTELAVIDPGDTSASGTRLPARPTA